MSDVSRTLFSVEADSQGYVRVFLPDHPEATDGFVFAHRLVMEDFLGGPIPPGAVVHHRDRNPSNNVLSNLLLMRDEVVHRALHDAIDKGDRARIQVTERWCEEHMRELRDHYAVSRTPLPDFWAGKEGAPASAVPAVVTATALRERQIIEGRFDRVLFDRFGCGWSPRRIAEVLRVGPEAVKRRFAALGLDRAPKPIWKSPKRQGT